MTTTETEPSGGPRPEGDEMTQEDRDLLSRRLLSAIVVTILALIVVVVVVGLARDNLDTTGVATVLSTLFSGIVVGTLLRGRGRDGPL